MLILLHVFCFCFLSVSSVKLWVSKSCPYAQRAWICANEKQVDAEVTVVDLMNKPSDFLELYSSISADVTTSAKVPILVDGNFRLIESSIIASYLEDAYPESGASLAPQSASDKAIVRFFIDTYEKSLGSMTMKVLSNPEIGSFPTSLKSDLEKNIRIVNTFLEKYGKPDGPFLLGSQFSLAEVNTAPFVTRLSVLLQAFCNTNLATECINLGCGRLNLWIDAVSSRISVTSTLPATDELVAAYTSMRERFLSAPKSS
jgi:glutathione S-transferase